ncbi:unnamed protein product [Sphagnum balticum]
MDLGEQLRMRFQHRNPRERQLEQVYVNDQVIVPIQPPLVKDKDKEKENEEKMEECLSPLVEHFIYSV